MARKPYISDDDWQNEPDSKKRKQIQDRLAQRARPRMNVCLHFHVHYIEWHLEDGLREHARGYHPKSPEKRRRLREAKNNAKQLSPESETPRATRKENEAQCDEESHVTESSEGDLHQLCELPSSLNLAQSPQLEPQLAAFDLGNISFCTFAPTMSPTTSPPTPITALGALYINGRILGLKCNEGILSKSTPAGPNIPLPLHPTHLQLTTMHALWIDRFPFPKMRDNLIILFGMLDDQEMIEDMFLMPSFVITPGCATWDPRAWKMEKHFADKWGYLLF
ncbi:hypothetical protein K504DRAFT_94166 [Pleomassaria siparia CBS 279.74]|uniref:Uncharacterized protein n=1 Tax=Pleomassaria siparia CBS 279.74 TaxID=1314801 RepID=A0A6G1JZF3_9PLEO|nr:hypothetical protein K504DRAFT_94166 [Pleomassaria siparia CBS 279.74]